MITTKSFKFENIRYFKFGYHPFGKPFLFVYTYFVDGLLIDTGQPKARKKIVNTLGELGVKQIFLTHHHEDHTGNAPALQEKFQCRVYAPSKCCELMKNPPPLSFAQQMIWGDRPANTEIIPKDELVETQSYKFNLIPIPGHAKDMVALYEPEERWLFSADLYVNSYIGYFLKSESVTQQIASMKRVLRLDFKVMFCSHNPRIDDAREKLRTKLQYFEDFYGQVIDVYKKGNDAKEVFKSLGLKEHGFTYLLSHGMLSKLNMVRSAIRDYEEELGAGLKKTGQKKDSL